MSRYEVVEDTPTSRYEIVEEPSKPSVGQRAARVAGLGARAVAEGVFGLPVMIGDALNQAYNKATGSERPSVQQGFQTFLDNAGLPRPETPVERISTGATSALAGAGSQMRIAAQAPGKVAELLTQVPGRQAAAAITGAVGSQGAAEAGMGPAAQFAMGTAGGMLPFARPMFSGQKPLTPAQETAASARQHGYVIPPSEVNRNPVNSALEGLISGKIQTYQHASAKNQPVTNRLVAEDLGLPKGTVLSDRALQGVRDKAGQAYQNIKMLRTQFQPDPQFQQDVAGLSGGYAQAQSAFPLTTGNSAVQTLQKDLLSAQKISPTAAIEKIKDLRFNANKNFKAFNDPEKAALAVAQKKAAEALEDLVERQLGQSGKGDLVQKFRDARQLIAKTYDAEAALNDATGNVNARVLAKRAEDGAMTGKMGLVARFGATYKDAVKTPENMGSVMQWSPLDSAHATILGLGGMIGSGSPGGATLGLAAPLARAGVRGLILSGPYQNAMVPHAQNLSRDQAAALGLLAASRQ